jgi:alanine dehydrogenase
MAVQVPMIDAAGVTAALPLDACIELMENALRAYDRGAVVQPLRSVIQLPDGSGSLYTMPAFIAEPPALAVKMITIFHGNAARSLPTHQGIVVVFDPQTGTPSLLLDAARLTAIRTAAVSAVATRALARADAAVLAMLGTGVQARSHIEALALVRPIREVRVWGRSRERARQLAREIAAGTAPTGGPGGSSPLEVIVCDSAADAVSDADIVCTTTSAREPMLRGEWLKRGAHINAIGASTPDAREVDSAAVAMARIFVDSIDAALTEAGDLLLPLGEGVTDAKDWSPIGAVLNGTASGRATEDDITLFKSVGLAIEDAAAAAHIARQRPASGGE